MDPIKHVQLLSKLRSLPEPRLTSIDEFFDGNDDEGSIGCNLWPDHPGIEAFRTTLLAVAASPGVDRVAIQISELDPGLDAWPFSDAIFIVGTADKSELELALSHLRPDEIAEISAEDAPAELISSGKPVFRVWWD